MRPRMPPTAASGRLVGLVQECRDLFLVTRHHQKALAALGEATEFAAGHASSRQRRTHRWSAAPGFDPASDAPGSQYAAHSQRESGSGGSSLKASSVNQTPRNVSALRAWYFGGWCSLACDSRPEKPLHGALRKTMCGRSCPAACWMSAAVASRQSAGGGWPWNASYCSRHEQIKNGPGHAGEALKVRDGRGIAVHAPETTKDPPAACQCGHAPG